MNTRNSHYKVVLADGRTFERDYLDAAKLCGTREAGPGQIFAIDGGKGPVKFFKRAHTVEALVSYPISARVAALEMAMIR